MTIRQFILKKLIDGSKPPVSIGNLRIPNMENMGTPSILRYLMGASLPFSKTKDKDNCILYVMHCVEAARFASKFGNKTFYLEESFSTMFSIYLNNLGASLIRTEKEVVNG